MLVSFAVPRGLPRDQGRNHLAVHTEDHPLEYLDFSGVIPDGEYGGGRMTIHDSGTYVADKWRDDEIGVTFNGERTTGRYVFFRTDGTDWMVRRMDPPEPGWEPMPETVAAHARDPGRRATARRPRLGVRDELGRPRAPLYVYGGRVRLLADGADVTGRTRRSGRSAARWPPPRRCWTARSSPSPAPCRPPSCSPRRAGLGGAPARAAERTPVQFLAYDLVWLEGHSTVELVRYAERRELLEGWRWPGRTGRRRRTSPGVGRLHWKPPGRRGWTGWSRNGSTRRTCRGDAAGCGCRSTSEHAPAEVAGWIRRVEVLHLGGGRPIGGV